MCVGWKMSDTRTAAVEECDVSGPHRQERAAQARIADAAAVRVLVVGRRAIFGVLVGIPRIGMPLGLPSAKGVVDATALMIAIDLVGESGGQKDDRRRRGSGRWQHIDRHDVLDIVTAQADAVNPGGHSGGNLEDEVGFPAAIVEIVLVEMNRGIVARPMPPIGLFAGPARAAHRARRQVAQMAVQTVRPAVDDPVGRDLGAEVPPGQAFGLVGLDWLRTVMRDGEHRGVFETAVEKGSIRVAALSRCWRRSSPERQPIQWAQATCCLGLARIGDTRTALQRYLTQSYS